MTGNYIGRSMISESALWHVNRNVGEISLCYNSCLTKILILFP